MRSRYVRAKCVLASVAVTRDGYASFELFDVRYKRFVSPDTEFPKNVGPINLYARFAADEAGTTRFRVSVWWLPNHRPPRRIHRFQLERWRQDFPDDEYVFAHTVFKLPVLQYEGVGVYSVFVECRTRRERRWLRCGSERFIVERPS